MEAEYYKCEKELKIKSEETDKLKTKIKDLKEIIMLSEKLKEKDLETSDEEEDNSEKEKEDNISWMKPKPHKKKNFQSDSSSTKSPTKEKEYNCHDCYFQGTKQMELEKHINLKHKKVEAEGSISCRSCGEGFMTKWNLMNHRKSKHSEIFAYCRNFTNGNCPYSDEMCWWNHSKKQNESIKCFICSKTFESRTQLMSHRKIDHSNLIKACVQFQQNNCRFRSQSCWFKHETNEEENEEENTNDDFRSNDSRNKSQRSTVFQKVSDDLVPPITNPEKNQSKQNQ